MFFLNIVLFERNHADICDEIDVILKVTSIIFILSLIIILAHRFTSSRYIIKYRK